MANPPTPPSGKGRPRGSGGFGWRAFFHQSTTPVFVLGRGKRLRYANPAWEKLTGVKLDEALGMVCSARRTSTPLQAALAPTSEALAGRADRARRPAPPNRSGPPWWARVRPSMVLSRRMSARSDSCSDSETTPAE